MWGHVFSEAVTRKSFLDPDSGVCVGCLFFKDTEPSPLQDSSSVLQQGGLPGRGFSEAVTRKLFLGPDSGNSNILLLLFSCTNKRTCGDMQDR